MTNNQVNESHKVLSCKLTSAEFRRHKQGVLAAIRAKITGKVELESGFRYQFDGNDETLDQLVEFIKIERTCCDFLFFVLEVNDASGPIALTISGYHGAKDFIVSELGF